MKHDTQYNDTQNNGSVVMLGVIYAYCRNKIQLTECRYANCHQADCHGSRGKLGCSIVSKYFER